MGPCMANRSSFGGVLLDVDPYQTEAESETLLEVDSQPSLRLLVMGDFSGQATGRLAQIDRDNFEAVMSSFAPHVDVAPDNGQLGDTTLTFTFLDEFEPDSIYRRSELFASLRDHSGRQLYSEPAEGESLAPLKPTAAQIDRLTAPGGLLDAIVEQSPGQGQASAAASPKNVVDLQSMVERIVAPYALPAESAASRHASTERVQRLSLLMAHILHDEQFQALEAAWRSLDLLVRGLDTDELVQIYVLDCSKEQICAQLTSAAAGSTGRWGLLVGNFAFDRALLADVEVLERISLLAQTVGAPFLAECLPSQQDDSKAEAAWQALRRSPAATYVGLALPRFLLRLPYGKNTVPVDAFDFDEMPGDPVHTDYLWGNPAFACALALGELFARQGSLVRIPANLRLSGLPLHVFRSAGETRTRPCTEVLLTDSDCQLLMSGGVLPLAAMKLSDEIVLPLMQSIADPPAALAGLQSVSW
jgi:type VI secretion system protein ImpC